MSLIEIPEHLEKLLARDRLLHGAVLSSLATFEPWIRLGGLPFFPEYTDHGPQHLTEVMASASSLIEDSAWPVMTPTDAAVLVLSILLHDSAMHLSEDGFLALLQPSSNQALPIDEPWPKLWEEFLSEASRFDARKLTAIFGVPEPAHPPDSSPRKWTMRDRLLIGEFMRRHHPRVAHEIALWGVPGDSHNPLKLTNVAPYVADLAGIIARSHGHPLRPYLDQLDRLHGSRWDRREIHGAHAVFLMALLRVSDYLQIQSERAPKQIMQIRHLNSPVSEGEWKAHKAVIDIRNTHDDREAVFIQAEPKEVRTFLKLKRLLQGIQTELDASWAVLGEVYGPIEELRALGLTLRRIRSNMDDDKAFAKTVSYIPCHAMFDSAGADLLKLLIAPLYGDRPEIGIRELMQNAVDACLELEDYLAHTAGVAAADLTDQGSDVLITLEDRGDSERYLTLSDRGIGMTADTVLNYFLKAGASFRRSDAWRRQHESEPGKSRLNRSGRFGIGVLAAFLLGDEISVSTRHVTDPPDGGVCFDAGLDSVEIELQRCSRPVGTTIRVRIVDEAVWEKLEDKYSPTIESWDWFCLSKPTVQRVTIKSGKRTVLPQQFRFAASGAKLDRSWRRITDPNYKDIQWQYSDSSPTLICNGIVVKENENDYNVRGPDQLADWGGFELRCPGLSVFDADGHLPLNLQRDSLLASRLPFHDQLREDALRDLIAWVMVNAPQTSVLEKPEPYARRYPGLKNGYVAPRWVIFASTPSGTVLADESLLLRLKPRKLLLIPSLTMPTFPPEIKLPDIVVPFTSGEGLQMRKDWFRLWAGYPLSSDLFFPIASAKPRGGRMLIDNTLLNYIRQPRIVASWTWQGVQEEWTSEKYTLLRKGDCEKGIEFKKIAHSGKDFQGLIELYLSEEQIVTEISDVGRAWQEYAGTRTIIPYKIEDRRRVFREPFNRLASYIEAWEKTARQTEKAPKP